MRILGIDPGTHHLGYGVIEREGTQARRLASGVLSPAPGPLEQRLARLFEGLEAVVAAHRPDVVAVEDLFHARNARSALVLGHARGVALLAAGRAGLAVYAYPPPVVKKAVVGHGRAEKFQVQKMVRALLGLEAEPAEDEADALAVALCHGAHGLPAAGVVTSTSAAPVAPSPRRARATAPATARPRPASSAPAVRPEALLPAAALAAALVAGKKTGRAPTPVRTPRRRTST